MTLRARRNIMAGEELTMPYTDVLQEVAVREEMMILVYHGIKYMKRKSRKASARVELEAALLNSEFRDELTFGLAKTAASASGDGLVKMSAAISSLSARCI